MATGVEVGSIIELVGSVIYIIDVVKKAWDALNDPDGQPEAFRQVAARLPLVRSILEKAKPEIKKIDDKDAKEGLEKVLESCEKKAQKLNKIFRKVLPGDKDGRLGRYKTALKAPFKGGRVEELMEGILKDAQLIATEKLVGIADKEQMEELAKAIKEMKEMPSSLPDETGPISQTHNGKGDNVLNTGYGYTNNHQTGPGTIHNNAGPTHYGGKRKKSMKNMKNIVTIQTGNSQNERQNEPTWDPASGIEHVVNIPQVNRFFTGQKKLLEEMQKKLCIAASDQKPSQNCFVIFGIGGVGKSEVCLRFATMNLQKFWGVFWVDASDTSTIRRGYLDCARQCHPPAEKLKIDDFKKAKTFFNNVKHPYLFVFDNADNIKDDLGPYLPTGPRATIIITTRDHEKRSYGNAGYQNLAELDLDDAIELLFKASNRSETDQIEKRCDAEAVVKLLAQHALAVVQAGAYIERSPCTFKEYKEEFQEQRKSLLSYEKTQDSTRYGGVYATFEVSAKLLKNPKKPNQSYANALELLGILGHLYFTGVPEDMFTRAWKYAQNIKKHPPHDDDIESLSAWHVSKLPKSLQESPPKNGTQKPPESLRKALAVLRSFAIITIQPETKDISMHPLIHAWAQDRLPKHDRHDAWASTMSLVALSLEFDFEYQSFWRRLQPHVETCIDASPKGVFNIYPTIDIGRVLYQFAWLFYRVNKYSQCKELTAKLRKKFCREGSGVMNSSSIEYLHAICLQSLAEFHAAKDILEGIVKINKGSITATKNSGGVESDKGLITVIKNSGGVKSDQGHTTATKISGGMKNENGLTTAAKISDGVKSGEGGLTTTVEISRGVVENGKGSTPATSKIQSSAKIALADIYLTEGSGRLVINIIDNIIDEVLHTREPPQQANALSVAKTLLIALNELVYMLLGDGSNKGAIAVLVAVIHIQNSANNTTHHDRPAPQHRFAIKLSAGTNNKKAIELLRELVHIQGMSGIQGVLLEPGNPTRLATQHELAVVLCTGREYKEAISIIQDVIWRRTSTLDPTHTNLLASKYLLASIYSQMGKHKEALETIRGVIYIAERIWDPSDERRRDCELLREHCEARTKGMLNALKQRIIELSSWNEKKNEGDKGGG